MRVEPKPFINHFYCCNIKGWQIIHSQDHNFQALDSRLPAGQQTAGAILSPEGCRRGGRREGSLASLVSSASSMKFMLAFSPCRRQSSSCVRSTAAYCFQLCLQHCHMNCLLAVAAISRSNQATTTIGGQEAIGWDGQFGGNRTWPPSSIVLTLSTDGATRGLPGDKPWHSVTGR
jgi:hypothetical protein